MKQLATPGTLAVTIHHISTAGCLGLCVCRVAKCIWIQSQSTLGLFTKSCVSVLVFTMVVKLGQFHTLRPHKADTAVVKDNRHI